jgi:GTPase
MIKTKLTVIAIGIELKRSKHEGISQEDSMKELAELANTANLDVKEQFIQQRQSPAQGTYIGKGKIQELKLYVKENDIKCVLTDDELTPAQSKFLEKELNVKVMDRTGLILEIFSMRAQTYEAQLQVELAQLNYLRPRLTRLWTHLSRLGGGIGTKGPGETQLESDKRQLARRVSLIKTKLKKIQADRHLRRKKRQEMPILTGAIVGYTNAGKSTLLNRVTNSKVLAENKLFATLDPTSRQCIISKINYIVFTDTVGFIQKLPTHLIKAFYSTLEEVTQADFILHVVDASHPNILEFIKTSQSIIKNLNANNKPILYIFNKWDLVSKPNLLKKQLDEFRPNLFMSAKFSDLSEFEESILDLLAPLKKTLTYFIPYNRMDIVNLFHKYGDVNDIKYLDKIQINVSINEAISDKIISQLY